MLDMDPVFRRFSFQYAFRSLWRNKRRTILTIATVMLSAAVSIVGDRYSSAIMRLWQEGASDTGSGHAQIHARGYWEKQEGVDEKLTLKNGDPFEKIVMTDENVAGSAKRLKFEGIISARDRTIYFIGIGVTPRDEQVVSPKLFMEGHDQGKFVTDDKKHGVTIGKGLAEALDLKLGDEATLITQTIQGSVNAIDVVVTGIVHVPLPSFSKRVVYVHIEHAQKLIRMPERYTELALRLKNTDKIENWVAGLKKTLFEKGVELRGWWEIEPIIRDVEKIFNSVVGVVALLLFLSASLSVSNIIYMLVAERTIEIGTLMAIGATPKKIRTLFTLEASLIGLFGGIAGCLVGNLVVLGMDFIGVPFDSPFGSGQVIVHPQISGGITLAVFLAAIIVCYLTAIPPSRKAALVEPVKAFRGQIT